MAAAGPLFATAASGAILFFGYEGWDAICQAPNARYGPLDTQSNTTWNSKDIHGGIEILDKPVTLSNNALAVPLGDGWEVVGSAVGNVTGAEQTNFLRGWADYNSTQRQSGSGSGTSKGQSDVYAWRGFIAGFVAAGLTFVWGSVLTGWSLYIPLMSAAAGFGMLTAIQFYACIIDTTDTSELSCILASMKKVFTFLWNGLVFIFQRIACFTLTFLRNVPVVGALLNQIFIKPLKKALKCDAAQEKQDYGWQRRN